LSIAFQKRAAAVDGNVFRVASRLEENASVAASAQYRKYLETELLKVYPSEGQDCADFTQSLFELGALVCSPQNPSCEICPLKEVCGAFAHGTQSLYPVLQQKREKRQENVFVFLIQTPQGFCIRRRETGVLKGLNEFPSFVCAGEENEEEILNDWGMSAFTVKKRQNFTHIFTHIRWDITCIWVRTESCCFDAYTLDEIEESISLPTAFKQCLNLIK
jgi:A/G-specific adenine glycosylase